MTVTHIDFIVEEPSMEAFLRAVLPKLLGTTQYTIHPFQNKDQLLKQLPSRLQGYAQWIPDDYRIVVLVDRDNDDCEQLKTRLNRWRSTLVWLPVASKLGIGSRSLIASLSKSWKPGISGIGRLFRPLTPKYRHAFQDKHDFETLTRFHMEPGNTSSESCEGRVTTRMVYAKLKQLSPSVGSSNRIATVPAAFNSFGMPSARWWGVELGLNFGRLMHDPSRIAARRQRI